MNSLSPLVVSKPRAPLLGVPPGTLFSHITIAVKQSAIKRKNAAVCQVQAIHVMNSKSRKPFSLPFDTESHVASIKILSEGIMIILYLKQILSLYSFLQNISQSRQVL